MTGETNSSSIDSAARSLFDDTIVPLGASHPELRLDFAPERIADSYYRPAFRPVLTREDMARGGEGGELAELRALWEGSPLAQLMPGLERLAQTIADQRQGAADDPDAPSTLIYQMY